jgi:subtilisin-like proprotein convertase family protein
VVNFSHQWFGDLEIILKKSPSNTIAILAEPHFCPRDTNNDGYMDVNSCPSYTNKTWVFGANTFMDEDPNGNWTLTVKDRATGDTGKLNAWGLKIYGR